MRKRCTWETKETCKMYELQYNEYEEVRILMFGELFRSFKGQNKHRDAKEYWNNIKLINA